MSGTEGFLLLCLWSWLRLSHSLWVSVGVEAHTRQKLLSPVWVQLSCQHRPTYTATQRNPAQRGEDVDGMVKIKKHNIEPEN